MNTETYPSIRLTHEELLFLLWLLKTPTIFGLGEKPLEDLKPEISMLLVSAGERSLTARDLITRGEDGAVVLDPVLLALVGPALQPEQMLSLSRSTGQELPAQYVYYRSHNIYCEHAMDAPGLHRFSGLAGEEEIDRRVQGRLFQKAHPGGQSAGLTLSQAALQQAREAAGQGESACAQSLRASGVSEPAALSLARAVAGPVSNTTVFFLGQAGNQSQPGEPGPAAYGGFGILEGADGLWLLQTPPGQPGGPVTLTAISSDGLAAFYTEFVKEGRAGKGTPAAGG